MLFVTVRAGTAYRHLFPPKIFFRFSRDVNKAGSFKAKANAKSLKAKAKAKSLKAKAKARSLKAKTKAKARDQG